LPSAAFARGWRLRARCCRARSRALRRRGRARRGARLCSHGRRRCEGSLPDTAAALRSLRAGRAACALSICPGAAAPPARFPDPVLGFSPFARRGWAARLASCAAAGRFSASRAPR
jgi:hypothetical protein